MKKFVATAAATTLMLAFASPAMAQATVVDDSDTVQFVDASQFQFAVQAQYGDANAAADDESIAAASIDQGITQNQANGGLDDVFDD